MNKRPVIIDTDPGIDDALAIAIALFSDELDVRLITTVAGNVSLKNVTNNTLKLLNFFEKDIPVAVGAAQPLIEPLVDASNVHGASGMEGFDFPEPKTDLLLKDHAQSDHGKRRTGDISPYCAHDKHCPAAGYVS